MKLNSNLNEFKMADQIQNLIVAGVGYFHQGVDILCHAEERTLIVIQTAQRYFLRSRSSFMEAKEIIQNSMVRGDAANSIPERDVEDVEFFLRKVDSIISLTHNFIIRNFFRFE